MTPIQRALRTLAQLIVAGGLTALVDQLAHGLGASTAALVLAGWQVVVTLAHNALEDAGTIPTLLKTPTPPPVAADVENLGGV